MHSPRPFPMIYLNVSFVCTAILLSSIPAFSQDAEPPLLAPAFDPASIDQQAMMTNMQKASSPAVQHEMMQWLVGSWKSTTRIWMGGPEGQAMETEGSVTNDLIMEGRFLRSLGEMNIMGQRMNGMFLIGYDTFANRYQITSLSTLGTAMHHATGYPTQDGRTLVFYGEMDEPTLEIHGRTVKYVIRSVDADTYVMEVHDLHIGLEKTKVLETEYRRQK